MAVAVDAVGPSSAGATSAASATLTWTHTNVGDGVALVVAVAVGDSNDSGVTMTAKLDPSGANLTIPSLGALIHSGAATAGFVGLFGLPNVSTGAHEITVTCSASVDDMKGGSTSYTGADLTTAFGAQQSFTQQGTSAPSITFTGSTAGNMISAGLAHGQSITSVTTGTSRWIRNVSSSSAGGNGAQADKAAGGSQAITWAATSDWCGIAAVEVLATAGPVVDTSGYFQSWMMPRVRNLLRSPFLQAPVTFWPEPAAAAVPVLTEFTAELGVDGDNVTQATMPMPAVATINGAGAYFRHDAATAMYGSLAYRVNVADSASCLARVNIESSKVQRLRFSFRLKSWESGARPIMNLRNTSPAVAGRLLLNVSRELRLFNAAGSSVLTGPVLDIDTAEYDISLLVAVGDTTGNSAATLKVYERGTTTQVGSTATANDLNLGTTPINVLDVGTNDSTTGALNYVIDHLRAENDVYTEFDPIAGAVTADVTIDSTSTMGVTPSAEVFASPAMVGSSALDVTPTVVQLPAVTLVGSSSMAITALPVVLPAISMASTSTMGVAPTQAVVPAVAMASTSAMSVTPTVVRTSPVAMAGASEMAVVGTDTIGAAVAMAGTSVLAVTPLVTVLASVAMASTSSTTVTGSTVGQTDVPIASTSTLSINATQTIPPALGMSSSSVLAVTPAVTVLPSVAMAGSSTLDVTPTFTRLASVTMASSSGLGITPSTTRLASVTIASTSTMSVSGSDSAAVAMAGFGAMVVTPLVAHAATVAMSSTSSMGVTPSVTVTATVTMAGVSSLGVTALVSKSATVTMAGSNATGITVSVTRAAEVSFAGASALAIAATITRLAQIAMASTSAMTVGFPGESSYAGITGYGGRDDDDPMVRTYPHDVRNI